MVRIINRADDHGDRTENLHVIVTNTYPTTGAIATGMHYLQGHGKLHESVKFQVNQTNRFRDIAR